MMHENVKKYLNSKRDLLEWQRDQKEIIDSYAGVVPPEIMENLSAIEQQKRSILGESLQTYKDLLKERITRKEMEMEKGWNRLDTATQLRLLTDYERLCDEYFVRFSCRHFWSDVSSDVSYPGVAQSTGDTPTPQELPNADSLPQTALF